MVFKAIARWFDGMMEQRAASRPFWLGRPRNRRDEPAIKVVCCYCSPWHTLRDGAEPASHGACPSGIARFESGAAA